MRKTITLTLLVLLTALTAGAVSRIYKGNSTSYYNILYTFDGKHIYEGNSTSYYNILYTVDGDHAYRGRSTGYYDILYTLTGRWPIPALMMVI